MPLDPKLLAALDKALTDYVTATIANDPKAIAAAVPAMVGLTGDAALQLQESIAAAAQAHATTASLTTAAPLADSLGAVAVTALIAGPPPLSASILKGGNSEEVVCKGRGLTLTTTIVVIRPDGTTEAFIFETAAADGTSAMFRFMPHGLAGSYQLHVGGAAPLLFSVRP